VSFTEPPRAALIAGSPSRDSRSRTLLEHARRRLDEVGFATDWIELARLPADALLGRASSAAVDAAVAAVTAADLVVAATPVYRATYSGLLKVFFDLLPQDALVRAVAVPIATGASALHAHAVTEGLIPLFSSVGALGLGSGVYATDDRFREGQPDSKLLEQVRLAVDGAVAVLGGPSAAEALGRR
jgi:FMN reductase